MSEARAALNGKWPFAIGTFFVMTLILIGASLIPIAGTILSLLITGPLVVGAAFLGLKIYKNEAAETNDLFFAFKHSFTNSVLAYLLMAVFILLRFLAIALATSFKSIVFPWWECVVVELNISRLEVFTGVWSMFSIGVERIGAVEPQALQ